MKKLAAIILLAALSLSITGCQSSGQDSNSSSTDKSSNTSAAISAAEGSAQSSADNSGAGSKYDFANYESKDIFDIEKVDLYAGSASYQQDLESKCTTYEFYFDSDGYKIKAYISIPAACIDSEKPCKCLLYNRGGHWNYGSLDPDVLSYICAATGRIVVACEIRGGNGSEGMDQFGGDEMHDVFRLIDLCEKKLSFVDMDDFCALGVSRGGMTTYMAARKDKRVRKIIVASGISDLSASYKERDDMQEMIRDCLGGTPEEKPEEYKKRSALYWADEIKIPVLIIHSKGDKQVKYETHAQAIYQKLKDSTDCTFITNEGDYHGINPDKSSQDIPEILKFLQK